MEKKIPELIAGNRVSRGVHVFYLTEQVKLYIENVLIFILDGIKQEDHVIIVDNKRLMPLIRKRLQKSATLEELEKVHFFDSYDLYWHKGDFFPSTIVDYFEETFEDTLAEDKRYRTWGHIEWGTEAGLVEELLTYEAKVDRLITEHNLIAVCAYDEVRVEKHLQEKLKKYHDFIMKDDQIIQLSLCLNGDTIN